IRLRRSWRAPAPRVSDRTRCCRKKRSSGEGWRPFGQGWLREESSYRLRRDRLWQCISVPYVVLRRDFPWLTSTRVCKVWPAEPAVLADRTRFAAAGLRPSRAVFDLLTCIVPWLGAAGKRNRTETCAAPGTTILPQVSSGSDNERRNMALGQHWLPALDHLRSNAGWWPGRSRLTGEGQPRTVSQMKKPGSGRASFTSY